MLLKCVSSKGDFEKGATYDVVEILEMPWHFMARRPGDAGWPRPGDPFFGWHPDHEVFELVQQPIEILSCGYSVTSLDDFYGVILDAAEDIALLQKWEELDPLETDQGFAEWLAKHTIRVREGAEAQAVKAVKALYMYLHDPDPSPNVVVYEDIVYPHDLKPFAAVGYYAGTMLRKDIDKASATEQIAVFLQTLAIKAPPPQIHDIVFWQGDGSPRLINADRIYEIEE
ncbi:MAG: hypothetical protein JXQ75_01395 [Phycisphaerae bacterium]|nr:hypothetical protein [Phycisphaerae bacterium]